MKPDYWHKQTAAKPLYPNLLWSRPENRQLAGKLLIVGGNSDGIASPAEAFRHAQQAGSGVVRMLLPDSMRAIIGKTFDAGEFAPTTPSGSFSQKALAEMLDMANWADAILMAGSFGKNSETAILLEKFAHAFKGQLAVVGDSIDYFVTIPRPILDRPGTLVAVDFSQLQKMAAGSHHPQAFTSQLDLVHFVELLHDFSAQHPAHLLVQHLGQLFAASQGQVTSTPNDESTKGISLLQATSQATVWWLQNPDKPLDAMTTALVAY